MRRFAELFARLDSTTSTNTKVAAMARYFAEAPAEDAAWALFFLTGRRLKRLVASRDLREWVLAATGLSPWLLEESHEAVGDVAETIALVLPEAEPAGPPLPLSHWIEERLLPLRELARHAQRAAVLGWWKELATREVFLLNKMITGELRVGVSATLVTRAAAEVAGVEAAVIAHRLMGEWSPSGPWFRMLLSADSRGGDPSRPYPFHLAHPLEGGCESLGEIRDWLIEWKWDGIRAQCVKRDGGVLLWSRGEELVTERFPELVEAARRLPDGTVLDGEILAWRDGAPLPFGVLQRRIGRRNLTPAVLSDAPAAFLAFDLLEQRGEDVRRRPLDERRASLHAAVDGVSPRLLISPLVEAAGWEELGRLRSTARERGVEGFMLKRRASPYGAGRKRGDWWKWKIDPYTIDAVLVYAQPGHGRRATLFTDYTFGVWNEGALVPVAKAYSGLSDEEIAELDRWIRRHTVERFGPVRVVEPLQVFEIAFEDIRRSTRHRSGVAVRFPRIHRWRRDKKPEDADDLDRLRALLEPDYL